MAHAPLIIVSGPSGSGKSTVIRQLLDLGDLPLHLSISVTTRKPRPGEVDGVHYHFWPVERFNDGLERDAFLEHAEVHGKHYGTLRSEVERYRQRGEGVLLDIDVQGADQVRRLHPDAYAVFLRASCWEEYERRLRLRGTEDESSIARRLETARRELARQSEYDHVIVNDDLPAAVASLHQLAAGLFTSGEETPCSTT